MIQRFKTAMIAAAILLCSNFSHAQDPDIDPPPPHSGFRHAIAITPVPFLTGGSIGAIYMKEKARSGLRIGVSGNHSLTVEDPSLAEGCNAIELTRRTQTSFTATVNWLKWRHYDWISIYYGGGLGGGYSESGIKLLRPGEICQGIDFAVIENSNTDQRLSVGGQGLVGVRFLFGKHFSLMADVSPVALRTQFGWSRSRTITQTSSQPEVEFTGIDSYLWSNDIDFFSSPSLWLGIHF